MDANADIARALADSARAMDEPSTLAETLDAIVHAARCSVPGIDAVSISAWNRDGAMETVAGTDQLAWELDEVQYRLGEGPCVDTLRGERVLLAEHLRHRQEWPRYVQHAVREGVRSQLGLQLSVDEKNLGGLNLYSTSVETLHPESEQVADPFATHAALALRRAREVHHLNTAMDSRKVIGQAIGMVMERYRVPEDRAFMFLVRASSTSNIKLRDIAQDMVDQLNEETSRPSP
jgi:GAF domain-containing protein